MKKNSIVVLALTSFIFSAFAGAQSRPQPPRPSNAGGGRSASNQQPGMPDELEKNISISITGAMAGGMPVALTMTGCGQIFRAEAILGTTEIGGNMIPTVGAIQYIVRPTGNGYIINYSIGARIAVPTSSTTAKADGPTTTSIGFEEILVDGTIRCKPGEAIEIFKSGDQAMTLKVVEN